MHDYDKLKVIKRINKLEALLFQEWCAETPQELTKRHDDGVLLHYLRALEKLKIEQD